jgi:hypothetical protein
VALVRSDLGTARWKRTRRLVLDRDGHHCVVCGSTRNLVGGHRIPPDRGGTDNPSNLICLCQSCNVAQGRLTFDEWRRTPSYARRLEERDRRTRLSVGRPSRDVIRGDRTATVEPEAPAAATTARLIHLIGAPGVGKSYVARRLGQALGLPEARIDQQRSRLTRPGDVWSWEQNERAWQLLMEAVRGHEAVIVETLGSSPREGELEAAAERVLRVLVTAPDDVRRRRLAERVRTGYMLARGVPDYVSLMLGMHPTLAADLTTDGRDIPALATACRAWLDS